MIGLLTVGFAHGEIPRQRCAIRRQDGVTKGSRGSIAEDVVGEVFSGDRHADAVFQGLQTDGFGGLQAQDGHDCPKDGQEG